SAKIRTIHKLAERRRRREMKNLFDTLRRCLPIDKTIRLSKWEVLKKAIEVI
ncbi:bHLH transcription factor-like protein, partial [Coemansia reversa NRRL 1564]